MSKNSTKKATKRTNYLVCVNDKEYSKVALSFACNMAKKSNGSITLLHVTEPTEYLSFGAVADKMRLELRLEAEKLLNELAKEIQKRADITPALVVCEGIIEDEIVRVIEKDNDINMLIVGAAADSSTKSKVIPPLVAQVGNKLLIPVLVVPGNLTKRQIEELT